MCVCVCVCVILQIERDTEGLLQCHPHPHEMHDPSRNTPHAVYFMGLQRRPGTTGEAAKEFDIRGTVDEFRMNVEQFQAWSDGMEIQVVYIKRKQLPLFVFPQGVRPKRKKSAGKKADGAAAGGQGGGEGGDAPPAKRLRATANGDEPTGVSPGGAAAAANAIGAASGNGGLQPAAAAIVEELEVVIWFRCFVSVHELSYLTNIELCCMQPLAPRSTLATAHQIQQRPRPTLKWVFGKASP